MIFQVNVVEGLKLYDEILDSSEITRLISLTNELRAAGRRGEFQGKFTFVLFLLSGKDEMVTIFCMHSC